MALFPSFEEFKNWNQSCRHNVLPVYKEVLVDGETPISLFQRVVNQPFAFLLESVENGEKWGRYSFVGFDPMAILESDDKGLVVRQRNGSREIIPGNPVRELKKYLQRFDCPRIGEENVRFFGGTVGYFGYDTIKYVEKLPAHDIDDLKLPDFQLMLTDRLVVFDHLRNTIRLYLAVHLPPESSENVLQQTYAKAEEEINAMIRKFETPTDIESYLQVSRAQDETLYEAANMTPEEYMEKVKKAKAYIAAGDIFQLVLSQRFNIHTKADPFMVYRILRLTNPSPYMFFLKVQDTQLAGSSPELLVRVENREVETMPIAGTRRRGQTVEEDEILAQELLDDPKERAEHTMLVDLGRNDIGRVARYGTVKTDALMKVERYSQVMHLVSHVKGQLKDGVDALDALFSCMPAGTVSGAPKLRAIEIIAELEREKRGPYAGAVGYWGYTGNLDTCITIRTILFQGHTAYVQAGAGIVWDSVPANEYQETLNKAKAMLLAINIAENMGRSREHVT